MAHRPVHAFGHAFGHAPRRQRGAFAVAAMIAMTGLLAMLGLAIDGGRLMSSKAKLQSAADSCALAAVAELVNCSDRAGCMARAVNQGTAAANANKTEMEPTPSAIAVQSVTFSADGTAGSYSVAGSYPAANANPRYAACTTQQPSVTQVFAGFFAALNKNTARPWGAAAEARATLAAGSQMCMNIPLGACADYSQLGTVASNSLITSTFQDNSSNGGSTSLGGSGVITLQWLSVAGGAGSVPDIESQVVSAKPSCYPAGTAFSAQGVKQGVKDAYNTRFGLYKSGGAYTATTAVPDGSGRVPNGTLSAGSYSSFLPTYQTSLGDFNTSGTSRVYNDPKENGNKSIYNVGSAAATTQQNYITYGRAQRRLLSLPVFNSSSCSGSMTLQTSTRSICVLALTPVTNGASGNIYFEYLGDASLPSSPCYGGPAAKGTFANSGFGSSIPVLVQ